MAYKFYSDIANFSAGFSVDVDAEYSANICYGVYFSISKDIPLYKGLILEPEIHVNPLTEISTGGGLLDYSFTYVGLGLKLKYRF